MKRTYINRKKKSVQVKLICLVFTLFVSLCLVSCNLQSYAQTMISPSVTPLPGTTQLPGTAVNGHLSYNLGDGSIIWTTNDTEFDLLLIGDMNSDTPNQVKLVKGEILIFSALPEGKWASITNPAGGIGRVTGSILYASFNDQSTEQEFICVCGRCQTGSSTMDMKDLPITSNPLSIADRFGDDFPPGFCSANPALSTSESPAASPTQTVSITASPMQSVVSATATTQPPSPGVTPSNTSTINFAATATAVCKTFQYSFPGTPCP